MKLHFTTVDVFTDRQFGGNPLAVVTNAQGLSTERMQAIAAEFNLAETTFVLPPEDSAHTAEVRIFTPKAEMPFAGHPNVGTAFVLARMGKVTGNCLVFEEKAGLVPMDIHRENGVVVATRLAAPKELSLGETVAAEIVASAVGLKPADIVGQPLIASTGNNFLFAEVRSRDVLKAALCNNDAFAEHLPMARTVGVHLYVAAREHGVEIQSRMFAPLYGVPEDPATGKRQYHTDRPAGAQRLGERSGSFEDDRPGLRHGTAEHPAGVGREEER